MTASKNLPSRPSMESLRKRAGKLSRQTGISRRSAQLAIAREYGYAGWQELTAEVMKRLGRGFEWAAWRAEQMIHDNDAESLRQLLAEYPDLTTWRGDETGVLLQSTTSYALDCSDPVRELEYNRPACAEVLLDAGAVVDDAVWQRIIETGSAGMLQLFREKQALPETLPNLAALGDLESIRAKAAGTLAELNQAFMNACRFRRGDVARYLLDRCIELDGDLGRRIDAWQDRAAFIEYISEHHFHHAPADPWPAFVMRQLTVAIHERNFEVFAGWLESDACFLGESWLEFQVELIEQIALAGDAAFLEHLLDLGPALLSAVTPPASSALIFAFDYSQAHLVPLLTRIWPVPDDLPHAAGTGDLDRVKAWFGADGNPELGDLHRHHPVSDPNGPPAWRLDTTPTQQILDAALAWSCLGHHFEVAEFLLAHGANVNTRWATHEPASILHECAVRADYEASTFLVDHGIDMTLRDYRYDATAEGWAYHAAGDEKMSRWLQDAKRQRDRNEL